MAEVPVSVTLVSKVMSVVLKVSLVASVGILLIVSKTIT